jgi:hypothetical protein
MGPAYRSLPFHHRRLLCRRGFTVRWRQVLLLALAYVLSLTLWSSLVRKFRPVGKAKLVAQ